MALLNAPCGCGGVQPTVIVYEDGSAPPVSGNRVTIPRPDAQQPWQGLAGAGITITQPLNDLALGNTPTIAVRVSPHSPVPLGFDAAGRLTAGPVNVAELQTALVVNGGSQVQGGLTVTQSGVKGHAVTVAIQPSSSSSGRVWIGPDGGLAADPPSPWVWESVSEGGNTRTIRLRNTLTNAAISIGTA